LQEGALHFLSLDLFADQLRILIRVRDGGETGDGVTSAVTTSRTMSSKKLASAELRSERIARRKEGETTGGAAPLNVDEWRERRWFSLRRRLRAQAPGS
jgi:hypothetical protein